MAFGQLVPRQLSGSWPKSKQHHHLKTSSGSSKSLTSAWCWSSKRRTSAWLFLAARWMADTLRTWFSKLTSAPLLKSNSTNFAKPRSAAAVKSVQSFGKPWNLLIYRSREKQNYRSGSRWTSASWYSTYIIRFGPRNCGRKQRLILIRQSIKQRFSCVDSRQAIAVRMSEWRVHHICHVSSLIWPALEPVSSGLTSL